MSRTRKEKKRAKKAQVGAPPRRQLSFFVIYHPSRNQLWAELLSPRLEQTEHDEVIDAACRATTKLMAVEWAQPSAGGVFAPLQRGNLDFPRAAAQLRRYLHDAFPDDEVETSFGEARIVRAVRAGELLVSSRPIFKPTLRRAAQEGATVKVTLTNPVDGGNPKFLKLTLTNPAEGAWGWYATARGEAEPDQILYCVPDNGMVYLIDPLLS